MELVKTNAAYVFNCTMAERGVPKAAGFRWTSIVNGRWATQDARIAHRVAEYASPDLRSQIEAEMASLGDEKVEAIKASTMTLVFDDSAGAYVFQCQISDRHVAKAAGFRFNSVVAGCWATKDIKIASLLSHYAQSPLRETITQAVAEKEVKDRTALSLSRAVDADIDLPCPEGQSYLGYQKAGIKFGLDRNNVLIADDMGLGKTIQGIGIFNSDPTVHTVLIIAPASVKLNWKREWTKWSVRTSDIFVCNGKTDQTFQDALKAAPNESKKRPQVFIINPEMVSFYRTKIDTIEEWDQMIIDEAHLLKEQKSLRTRSILGDPPPR